jgi:hypothetical protein
VSVHRQANMSAKLPALKVGVDLRRFIRRSMALSLYRQALRVACAAPPHVRADIVAEARTQFRNGVKAAEDDPSQEKFLLAQAAKDVDALRKMFTLSI